LNSGSFVPGVQGGADQVLGFGSAQGPDGGPETPPPESHGAETKFGNEQAGLAETSVVHGNPPRIWLRITVENARGFTMGKNLGCSTLFQ